MQQWHLKPQLPEPQHDPDDLGLQQEPAHQDAPEPGAGCWLRLRLARRAAVLPRDGTMVCTKQFCAYRDRPDEFAGLNATVVGMVRHRHDHLLGLDYQSVVELKSALYQVS